MNWENVKNVSDNDESGRFVTVTNVNYLQDTTRALSKKKCSYIIVCSKQILQDLKDWKIIIQQKFKDSNYLVLLKKKIILEENVMFIKSTYDNNYDLKIWSVLDEYNASGKLIYIISKHEPLEGINTYVEKLLMKYKSQNLRFLFILDENAPDFKYDNPFYSNQLSKDLIVNIYKNGGWGSYKRRVLQDLKDNIKATKNIAWKNISLDCKNELTVAYLGLNFKHLVIEDSAENKFGPLEYAGYMKNNERVMGIGLLDEISFQIKHESLLSWPIPSNWSLEDATTVPLTYAISYYVFNILCSLQKHNSILVTSGLHPIGQAAISIGLAKKCEMYAIVESTQQADHISNIFPELKRSRILINSNNKFDIQLKMITKGKGIDFILNFLSGEAFHAAFRTIAYHGKFFHFSKSDMKNYEYIGTRIFLQNTSFSVVTSNMLLNENEHNKQIVQEVFMDGLNKGVIKPFPWTVLTIPLSCSEIFHTMRTNSTLTTSKKVVLPLNNDFINSDFQKHSECVMHKCDPDQIYVIVGNTSDWLELAEWLVDRGAQKIVISVKKYFISSTTCRRFDKLLSRNVSIQIVSDSYLKTKEGTLNWLNRLTISHVLSSIFIVNQFDNYKVMNMRYAFEKNKNKIKSTSFICISSKAEHICAELKSSGFNAIHISWDGVLSQPKVMAKLLLSLDTLLHNSNNMQSSSFVCTENGNKNLEWTQQMNDVIENFFPDSTDELHFLNEKITKEAGFVEVQTRSPRFSYMKSVTPVFVIPGFRPKLIESLYKQLFYPVFEAQLPENIGSVDELSEILVNKLKSITDQGYVSLIGESWGGIVALKMAQILEARGMLVTVSLLEGDPEMLTKWAESFLSNDHFTKKLNTIKCSFSDGVSKYALKKCEEEFISQNISSYLKTSQENTQRTSKIIRSRLQALLDSKPLSNKLHTKVLILRYQRSSEFDRVNLKDYCANPPFVYITTDTDFKHMMENKDNIEIINKMVIHQHPIGIELPLQDKYKNYYSNFEKCFKSLIN